MSRKRMMTAVVVTALLASAVIAASIAKAAGPPSIAAGPAFGFVPSHNANKRAHGRELPLTWHGGPVMHSTAVIPVYWGSGWSS